MTVTPAALPALELTGTVMAVSSRNLGTSLANDTPAGATSLTVIDNATVVQGNQLQLTDPETGATEIVVVADTIDADVISLTGGTANAYAAASTVTRVPAASEVVAFVSIIDQAEPLPIVVEHSLADALARGTREAGHGETVRIGRNSDGDLRVVDVLDRSTDRPMLVGEGTLQTGQDGQQRFVMREDESGGIFEWYTGLPDETPGSVNPTVFGSGSTVAIKPGSTPGYPATPELLMTSTPSGSGYVAVSTSFFHIGDSQAYIEFPDNGNVIVDVDGVFVVQGSQVVTGSIHALDVYADGETGAGTIGASLTNQGRLIRTPSTRKVKKDIEPLPLAVAEKVLDLEPVTYRRKVDDDDDTVYPGFIAEQAADVGADLWVTRDKNGDPSGFRYPETTVALVSLARAQRDRITQLETNLADVLTRLAALEGDH